MQTTRSNPSTSAANHGSRTLTLNGTNETHDENESTGGGANRVRTPSPEPVGALRLRGRPLPNAQRVQWDEAVVDNEGMNKKKSKICCIYHKPKAFDESSSEDESDSSCGSADSRQGQQRRRRNRHQHGHNDHSHSHDHGLASRDASSSTNVQEFRSTSPEANAYERQPSNKGKGKSAQ